MYLPNTQGQNMGDHYIYDCSNTITVGGTAQLVLPFMKGRSSFEIVNMSDTIMYMGFGGARATATLTGTGVSSITVTNAGFGYSIAPIVQFIGGGNTSWNEANSTFLGCKEVGYPAPAKPASAICVMTGSAPNMSVASITINNPGVYATAPRIFLKNDKNDPFGAFLPAATSPGSIILGATGGNYYRNHTNCFDDQVSIVCATSNKVYSSYYMP